MPRPKNNELGPLEAEVMEIVWAHVGSVTVKEIHVAIQARRAVAYTTVMTAAVHLWEKGILHREQNKEGHGMPWRYTARISRQALIVARVEQLLATIGVNDLERQFVAAEIRRGRVGI